MTLHQEIKEEIKEAMKAKDAVRLGVVRGLVTGFMNELVATKRTPQSELSDDEVLSVISRAVKQRKDSIEQFTKGGRVDLADNEKAELAVLETYLPAQMSRNEVVVVAKAKMVELGVGQIGSTGSPQAKMGMLMGAVMKELKGKTDGDVVKSVVDELLSQ
ncbi:MAG TPA: GatB/YqeY domain-containing protein [Candidatus Paceibacterota bacterium]